MPEEKKSLLCTISKKYNISIIGVIAFAYVIGMLIIYYKILGNPLVMDGWLISVIIVGIIGIIILILDEFIASKCDGEQSLLY